MKMIDQLILVKENPIEGRPERPTVMKMHERSIGFLLTFYVLKQLLNFTF